jgi:hypothetical protein|tara:strand:- start:168 stop:872 length:705 start_codon:yes stop_codon:yes gene_type:complete
MIRSRILIVTIGLSFILAGCAGKTATYNLDYIKPEMTIIDNEVIVMSDYDKTWSDLVGEMSKSFYVINNIDKESRLINLSFSITNNISDYVDCGISSKSFSLGDMIQNVSYKTADKSENYISSTVNSIPPNTSYFKQFRSPTLEGRANVYVAPQGGRTIVSVNTRYVWDVNQSFEEYMYMPLYNRHDLVRNKQRNTNNDVGSVSFNTNNIGSNDEGLTCVATGKFEKEILDIIR